jgi:hypothetical protein
MMLSFVQPVQETSLRKSLTFRRASQGWGLALNSLGAFENL